MEDIEEFFPSKDIGIGMGVEMPEFKSIVAGFGKHPAFIGSVNFAVVIIDDGGDGGSGRVLKIDKGGAERSEHFPSDESRIIFGKRDAFPVEFKDVGEAFFVKAKPFQGLQFLKLFGFECKSVGRKRA